MHVSLSEEQIREVVRCAKDPVYFIETFAWLEEKETRRILQFDPFPYQRQMLEWMHGDKNVLALKSRRVGCSWITAAYAAWLINFHKGVNVLFLSKREEDSKKLLKKVKFILKNLAYRDEDNHTTATKAPWLCNEIGTDRQQLFTIVFRNKEGEITAESEAASLTTTSESGRSEGASLIFLDEFAFVKPDDEATWSAIKPTVARGGKWVMVSTPRGVGGVFHRLCMEADRGENKHYEYLKVHWTNAGITQEQYESAVEGMDSQMVAQEWELDFVQSGNPVFNATDLAACYKPLNEYPEVAKVLEGYRNKVGVYYNGVDSAVGKAHTRDRMKDYSSWVSLTKTGIQAFAYHSKEPISKWAGRVEIVGDIPHNIPGTTSKLHIHWPGPTKVEDNGPGQTVLDMHVIPQDSESALLPSHTDAPTKSRLINRAKLSVESHAVTITDLFLYQCMLVYQHGNVPGQYEAPQGYNDDPVMAFALANDLLFDYGSLEFEWADGQPAKRTMTPEEVADKNIIEAPLGPEVEPFSENMRLSALMPGPGESPSDPSSTDMPTPALDLVGEPRNEEYERYTRMRDGRL